MALSHTSRKKVCAHLGEVSKIKKDNKKDRGEEGTYLREVASLGTVACQTGVVIEEGTVH